LVNRVSKISSSIAIEVHQEKMRKEEKTIRTKGRSLFDIVAVLP
jgi:hypothetical protein